MSIDSTTTRKVLIVEDDPAERSALIALVSRKSLVVRGCATVEEARGAFDEFTPHVVFSDLELPDGSGLELLAKARASAQTEVVFITGKATIDSAVSALRDGALDYLTKPVDIDRLEQILADIAEVTPRVEERVRSLAEAERSGAFGQLIGRSPQMMRVYQQILRVAPTSATVLIEGETGTGKELVAQMIHELSGRSTQPFVALNCGAVSATLIESELFGHEKGSFTGANRRHVGLFERAQGGTLFLDEVTEMPLDLQVKLLRVLESRQFQRVGGEEMIVSGARLVAATNRDPLDAIKAGKLREDLYYRLRVFPLFVPPLRSRSGDISLLAERFLEQHGAEQGVVKHFSPEVLAAITDLKLQGNVRELKNLVHRLYILADDVILPDHLHGRHDIEDDAPTPHDTAEIRIRVGSTIAAAEKALILATLASVNGDKHKAANLLGISVKTLYTRLSVYHAVSGEREAVE